MILVIPAVSYFLKVCLFEKLFYTLTPTSYVGKFLQMKCLHQRTHKRAIKQGGLISALLNSASIDTPLVDEAPVHYWRDGCTCATACLHQRDLYVIVTATDQATPSSASAYVSV